MASIFKIIIIIVCMYAWTCNGRHFQVRQFFGFNSFLPLWILGMTYYSSGLSDKCFLPTKPCHQISRKILIVSLKVKVIIYLFVNLYIYLCFYLSIIYIAMYHLCIYFFIYFALGWTHYYWYCSYPSFISDAMIKDPSKKETL